MDDGRPQTVLYPEGRRAHLMSGRDVIVSRHHVQRTRIIRVLQRHSSGGHLGAQ